MLPESRSIIYDSNNNGTVLGRIFLYSHKYSVALYSSCFEWRNWTVVWERWCWESIVKSNLLKIKHVILNYAWVKTWEFILIFEWDGFNIDMTGVFVMEMSGACRWPLYSQLLSKVMLTYIKPWPCYCAQFLGKLCRCHIDQQITMWLFWNVSVF